MVELTNDDRCLIHNRHSPSASSLAVAVLCLVPLLSFEFRLKQFFVLLVYVLDHDCSVKMCGPSHKCSGKE